MASTSSTPPIQGKTWNVFISFRGDDTRYGILSHLSKALEGKGIKTFTDELLGRGEEISPELLKIIRESSVSIVIFSKNYADSPWCLDELVEIHKCRKESGQIVLPVFYKVDSTEVQELTGNFRKAFDIAVRKEKDSPQKVDNWKRALSELSIISGRDSQSFKDEAELVDEVVNDVLKKFNDMSTSYDSYDRKLIGIKSRVEKVEWLLTKKQVVGIWGMGGIGKTTIAQEIFRRNKNQFGGHCFVENVREKMTKQSSKSMRDKIICKLLGEKKLDDLNDFVRTRLKSQKVLIVFDDVEDPNQLKDLEGECDLYGEGSRIIITSRDSLGFSEEGIYKVEKLSDPQGLELFSLHAFEQNRPKEEYKELSNKATNYAGGIPLALKVLGSHLFNMQIEEWESELEKLEVEPLEKIQAVLKTSYDGLGDKDKDIFLDIACFFKGKNIDEVERKLEAFGFYPKSGIPRLIKKSLITVSSLNEIHMHDLLEQMGKDIVIKECKQPWGRSRLWNFEDIDLVLTTDKGNEKVECLSLEVGVTYNLESPTAFEKLCNLRFLQFRNAWVRVPNKKLEFLPQTLRYIDWGFYPLESLPLNFCPKNLVELHMPYSNLTQLWKGGDKPLKNLKLMDLRISMRLTRIPDLCSIAPDLQILCLTGCDNLVEIPSLQNLSKLTELSLGGTHCPEIPFNIRILRFDHTGIKQLPSSIEHLSQLVKLSMFQCSKLVSLPSGIGELKSLEKLVLIFCSNLRRLPKSIKQLSKLKQLDLSCCERLKCLPKLPSCLEYLGASNCISLKSASTSFLFLEDEDENEEVDKSESEDDNEEADENEEAYKSEESDENEEAYKSEQADVNEEACKSEEADENEEAYKSEESDENEEAYKSEQADENEEAYKSEQADVNEEACKSEEADENEEAYESCFEVCKFLDFCDCVNLEEKVNKKVMEDVFKAHQLGEKVRLYMEGGEVPEGMKYKNKGSSLSSVRLDLHRLIAFSFCVVLHPTRCARNEDYLIDPESIQCSLNFIDGSGYRRSFRFILYFYGDGPGEKDELDKTFITVKSEHALLSFNGFRARIDEDCFVEASFRFFTDDFVAKITKCGVHPIYSTNEKRSRNEEQPHQNQDDEKGEPPLQRLEQNENQNASIQRLTEEEQPHQHQDEEKGERIVEEEEDASIPFSTGHDEDGEIECGVHPIYQHEIGEEGFERLEQCEEEMDQNDFLNHKEEEEPGLLCQILNLLLSLPCRLCKPNSQ